MINDAVDGTLDLGGLIGETAAAATERLGRPAADRATGEDRWMLFEREGWTVRLRLSPVGGGARVRSWTARHDRGFSTLEDACRALSLSPAPAREGDLPAEPRLLRRALPAPGGGTVHSLTAGVRAGLIRSLTAFDEPPDWDRGDGAE